MATLEEIKSLNTKIAQLNRASQEASTKKKVLLEQLKEKCEGYSKEYGVKLWGANLKELQEALTEEYSTLDKQVQEEYALASEVTEAIQEGDSAKARKLLGLPEEEVPEAPEKAVEPAEQAKEPVVESPEKPAEDTAEDDFGSFDFGNFGFEDEEEPEEEPKKKTKGAEAVSRSEATPWSDVLSGTDFDTEGF